MGTRLTVLVAIEPRTYREVIGEAIRMLRPDFSVRVIEPGMLDTELSRTDPALVLCNGVVERSVRDLSNRVVFGCDESDSSAVVHVDGRRSEVENVDLDRLLGIVDRVASSSRGESDRPEGPER